MPSRGGSSLRILDLRKRMPEATDPLPAITQALSALTADGVLEVLLDENPASLGEALRSTGLSVAVDGGQALHVSRTTSASVIDLTDLEPPEPMLRVLSAVASVEPGEVHLFRLPRRPVPLFAQLDFRGLEHDVALRSDGTALVWVAKPVAQR